MKIFSFIYILTNTWNTTLYIGVTSNLKKRIWEHRQGVVDGFTKKYKLHKLIYFELFESIENAIAREKYLKGKKRVYKEKLINKKNPKWIDLYETI